MGHEPINKMQGMIIYMILYGGYMDIWMFVDVFLEDERDVEFFGMFKFWLLGHGSKCLDLQ